MKCRPSASTNPPWRIWRIGQSKNAAKKASVRPKTRRAKGCDIPGSLVGAPEPPQGKPWLMPSEPLDSRDVRRAPDVSLEGLPESHRSIAAEALGASVAASISPSPGRRCWSAVGYMDPGNWATDLARRGRSSSTSCSGSSGSRSAMAIVLQVIAARLGVVTGKRPRAVLPRRVSFRSGPAGPTISAANWRSPPATWPRSWAARLRSTCSFRGSRSWSRSSSRRSTCSCSFRSSGSACGWSRRSSSS